MTLLSKVDRLEVAGTYRHDSIEKSGNVEISFLQSYTASSKLSLLVVLNYLVPASMHENAMNTNEVEGATGEHQ